MVILAKCGMFEEGQRHITVHEERQLSFKRTLAIEALSSDHLYITSAHFNNYLDSKSRLSTQSMKLITITTECLVI